MTGAEPMETPPERGSLATAIATLAGTPDYQPSVDALLATIARLSAQRVAPARFASVTALRGKIYTTVALSDDVARILDEVQYAIDAGPCLDALDRDVPVGLPDIDKTVQWPGFREVAAGLGLQASVSVPLYAGRGDAVAALNVYSHDRAAMAPLITAICAVHRDLEAEISLSGLDTGGQELLAGYTAALGVRATVRLALALISDRNRCSADDAYLSLCIQAGETGTNLGEAAAAVIQRSM